MSFVISAIAKLDLDDIYEYSIIEFGIDRTIQYLMEMEDVFITISDHHKIGTTREHIDKGLFAISYFSHMIFYRIDEEKVIIIERVLHGSKDIPNHFIK